MCNATQRYPSYQKSIIVVIRGKSFGELHQRSKVLITLDSELALGLIVSNEQTLGSELELSVLLVADELSALELVEVLNAAAVDGVLSNAIWL